jgi:uncharacterized protein (DUF1778 family)
MQYHPAMATKPLPQRQDKTLSIRLYSHELQTIKIAAKRLGISLADYVRDSCIARAKRAA